jgi:hypothetical protein
MTEKQQVRYLRGLMRRLLIEGRNRTDENCAFCDGIDGCGFVNCGRHAINCPGNEARKYLAGKRNGGQP